MFNFNKAVDLTFGSIFCLCFLIGTLGNIISFLFFKSKKRDISNVIYLLITANDIVLSLTSLPIGISYLNNRKPGVFGNKYGCVGWYYVWMISMLLSVFLVLCLSVARTVSLLKPFLEQKIRYLFAAIALYTVLNLAQLLILHSLRFIDVVYVFYLSLCTSSLNPKLTEASFKAGFLAISINNNIVIVAPAIAVIISCAISVLLLTRKNNSVKQRELQQSRNRATVTILLFALLYGVCNAPVVVHFLVQTYSIMTQDWPVFVNMYKFDTNFYYRAVIFSMLHAINSAANPVLYFWRMKPLRDYTLTVIQWILGNNRGLPASATSTIRRPTSSTIQRYPVNRTQTRHSLMTSYTRSTVQVAKKQSRNTIC